jgi:hypothetical protein
MRMLRGMPIPFTGPPEQNDQINWVEQLLVVG